MSVGTEVLPSLPQKDSCTEENVSTAQSVHNTSNVMTGNKKVGPAVTAKPKKTSPLKDPGEYLFMPGDVLPYRLCHVHSFYQYFL